MTFFRQSNKMAASIRSCLVGSSSFNKLRNALDLNKCIPIYQATKQNHSSLSYCASQSSSCSTLGQGRTISRPRSRPSLILPLSHQLYSTDSKGAGAASQEQVIDIKGPGGETFTEPTIDAEAVEADDDYHSIITDTEKGTGPADTHEFQAEKGQLLGIVPKSLYSEKEINSITMGLVETLLDCIFVRSGFFYNVIFPIMRTVMNTFPSLAIKAAKGDGKSNHVVTDANGATIRVFKKGDKLYPAFGGEKLASVKHLTIRDSDILLAGYPKTGAHWMYEIMYMLVTGKRETSKYGKDLGGFIDPLPNVIIDSLPSPRVLNTHFSYEELPDGIKEKNTKIVVTVRNPKDTCVSFYNHHKNIPVYEYNGEFDAYFKLFMTGEQDYGSYYDATKKWDALAQTPPKENQILMISYEDLKKNPDETVQKVADFLDVTVSAQGIKDILVACGFEKMKAAKSGDAMAGKLFRKGKTGDWKNWLSDAQSDEMDRMWRNKMADCAYEPTY